jgi:ubiquinone/menaquinone biosynthesis C-methylase UbiE
MHIESGVMAPEFPYDVVAPSFELHRTLPPGVPEAIRGAVLGVLDAGSRPRLLDVGGGTGRVGRSFVAAGEDYIGVDLSFGMLREFMRQARDGGGHAARLVQADGLQLPFRDATFDAVLLIQVAGAARSWSRLLAEGRRVLRPAGALVTGRTTMLADGLDARMKQRLAVLLDELGVAPYHQMGQRRIPHWLESVALSDVKVVAAAWTAERTPRGFLDRQRTAAHFASLPEATKEEAMRRLSSWAQATFGSLDVPFSEEHAFELRVFKFK